MNLDTEEEEAPPLLFASGDENVGLETAVNELSVLKVPVTIITGVSPATMFDLF
jgi:hypothetical protein